jgi:hypothetical protein
MKQGDNVVWFSQSKRGKVISFRKGYGVIKRVEDGVAVITTDCKGTVRKPLGRLTLKENDTPLSIFGEAAKSI